MGNQGYNVFGIIVINMKLINDKKEFEEFYPYDKKYIKEYPKEYPCIVKCELS